MARFGREATAIAIMAIIIAVLFVLCTPRSTSRSSALRTPRVRVTAPAGPAVRVLVLDYDPIVRDSGGRRMHEAFGWNAPRTLARDYARDVAEVSGGLLRYDIVAWRTLDEFPRKRDGFRYTAARYAGCLRNRALCHDPDGLDYDAMLRRQGVQTLVNRGEIDAVWLFGGPYFGYFESAMAGPGAFDINGDAFPRVRTTRAFPIMGFNSERGVAEMLHNLCHRTEATMTRVYGGWRADSLGTTWARFAANVHQSGGRAGVGSCHFPPNATAEYDYANPSPVASDADDWLGYPDLTGDTKAVSAESWGGPDHQRQYMRWWFERLPRAPGAGPDGKLNNWWAYIVGFDSLLIAPARAP